MSKPSQTPDYGEPWNDPYPESLAQINILNRHNELVRGRVLDQRKIECVNACAGMADPAAEIQAMRDALNLASVVLDMADNEVNPPDTNCSCHINPPCNDCVDHSQARETKELIESTLAKLKPFTTP